MMLFGCQYIDEVSINIELSEVLRIQGYRADISQGKERVRDLVKGQIDRGYRLVQPRAVFRVFSARLYSGGRVRLDEGRELLIGRMAEKWAGLKYLALAICTIGDALEREVSGLFNAGEYASAVVLDCVGSVAAESLTGSVNKIICQQVLSDGLSLTPRISPGYSGWNLQEQKTIFALLSGDKAGVTLTGKSMMHPRKSISFAVGIGEGFTFDAGMSQCRNCYMADCPYRTD
jgi:hypothetical protein